MTNILGLDPGSHGGMCLLEDITLTGLTGFSKMTDADIYWWIRERHLEGPGITMAFLELVGPMPRQSASSSFKFGRNYGFLGGLLVALQIPFTLVRPQIWQPAIGFKSKGLDKPERKRLLKDRAQKLFPTQTFTLETADATLIAEYGRRHFIDVFSCDDL